MATNTELVATFDEAFNPDTVTSDTFTLTGPGNIPVSGTVTHNADNTVAVFTPNSNLAADTTYTATLTTGIEDAAGNSLASAYVWTFTTTATAADVTAPVVATTSPITAKSGVATNTKVVATFDEAFDPDTVNSNTFTLTGPGNTPVSGTVTTPTADDTVAVFTPDSNLAANTTYTATLTTGIEDAAGNSMDDDHTWTFTTAADADVTAPMVASTSPTDAGSNVGTNTKVVATFDEEFNASTLNSNTFTVTGPGNTPVSGTVTHNADHTIAVFTPDSDLEADTTYTATLTTGIEDVAGNALDSAFVWTFTTAAAADAVGEPIFLGTAADFAILSETGISNTGATTRIVGDIGVSPVTLTAITGFDVTLHGSNQFATSDLVNGKIYAAAMAAPTPAKMTTAIADMQTAYTEAAGRTSPDFTELGAGDISGLTLPPGLYKWGTGVSINSNVTLNGGPNDVWVFQIAQGLTVASGAQVILTGGAVAENIFWQVAEAVTLNTTAVFNGIALSKTGIVLATGAVANGRLLAQTAVTLDANAVTAP